MDAHLIGQMAAHLIGAASAGLALWASLFAAKTDRACDRVAAGAAAMVAAFMLTL